MNILNIIDKFPLNVATGDAFCNRVDEIGRLKIYLQQKRPILLMSPRRYGKTSLALKAIKEVGLPYAHIDMFSVVDEEDIERVILEGVAKLISQMGSTLQKALNLANKIFNGTTVKVALTSVGIEVDFQRNQEKPAYRILEVLERLDKLAEHTDKPMVLFLDEFQTIGEITTDHSIEAVLRQIAQLTKSISFVFSGSNRHMLRQMFEDRNRPFYKLCEKISLDRIEESAYLKHIQRITAMRWGAAIDEKASSAIFKFSECHPYYVNVICSRMLLGDLPSKEDIASLWDKYILEERSNVAAEIDLLSKNQRKLLTILSRVDGHKALSGKEFIKIANMSKPTISQAYEYLLRKDYLYKDDNEVIRVLDPLIKSALAAK